MQYIYFNKIYLLCCVSTYINSVIITFLPVHHQQTELDLGSLDDLVSRYRSSADALNRQILFSPQDESDGAAPSAVESVCSNFGIYFC